MTDTYTMTPEKLRQLLEKDAPTVYAHIEKPVIQIKASEKAVDHIADTGKMINHLPEVKKKVEPDSAEDFEQWMKSEEAKRELELKATIPKGSASLATESHKPMQG